MKIILNFQIPSGKNSIVVTRSGHRFPAKRFVLWREIALKEVAVCVPKIVTIDSPCSIQVDYIPGDRRRRDVPGMLDAIFHLLERSFLVKDDALIQNVMWRTFPLVKGKSRTEIELTTQAWAKI